MMKSELVCGLLKKLIPRSVVRSEKRDWSADPVQESQELKRGKRRQQSSTGDSNQTWLDNLTKWSFFSGKVSSLVNVPAMFDDTWYIPKNMPKSVSRVLVPLMFDDIYIKYFHIFPGSEVWPLFRACYNLKLLMFQEQVVEWQNGHRSWRRV